MLVGITGPSGAGKGLVVRVFEARGFLVIDADAVAREVVMPGEPALAELARIFGSDIVQSDGTLDRRLLAARAFSSRESTDRMNAVMLREIVRRMTERAAKSAAEGRDCLFDAPLLFEAGLESLCDCCVAVVAPEHIRISRLAARDGITQREIRSRMQRQHADEYYTSRCEYVIVNDGGLDELTRLADAIAEEILNKYRKETES